MLKSVGALVLFLSLVLGGCGSDAQRIREFNEGLATPASQAMTPSAKIDSIDIQDGDCINSTLPEGIGIETVVIVRCVGAWQYRALNSFEVPGANRYPGEDAIDRLAYEHCDRRYSFRLSPTLESWELGDRTVNCLQDSFGLSVVDPDKLDRIVSNHSLSPGECYNEAPETGDLLVELVDCTSDPEFRVVDAFEVPEFERYPGEIFLEQLADNGCDAQDSFYLYPSAGTWGFGERTITCVR